MKNFDKDLKDLCENLTDPSDLFHVTSIPMVLVPLELWIKINNFLVGYRNKKDLENEDTSDM